MSELTATIQQRREYKDLSLTFARNPVTHDVATVSNEVAIKRSLRVLLLTREGEAPFYPNFGSRLHQLLFEPATLITEVLLQNEIRNTIDAFEPRVKVLNVDVALTADERGYNVNLTFRVVNTTTPLTLTLYLSRLR